MKRPKATLLHRFVQVLIALIVIAVGYLALSPHRPAPSPGVQVKIEDRTLGLSPEPIVQGLPAVDVPPYSYEEHAVTGADVKPVEPGSTVPSQGIKPPVGAHPKIALVIDDAGIDVHGTQRAVALPSAVTLSFLPYARHLQDLTRSAREAGHELLLHMPMEPVGHDDPGPNALTVGLPTEDIRARLQGALASFIGFDGVNNHMGSKFTANTEGMAVVIEELKGRGLFFLDSRTTAKSVGETLAREQGLPTIARDVFLDDSEDAAAVHKQLEATERVAMRKGLAVAIGHPHSVTLDALEQWLPTLQARGFELVPLNSVVIQP